MDLEIAPCYGTGSVEVLPGGSMAPSDVGTLVGHAFSKLASATQSRSSILAPLYVPLGILACALVGVLWIGVPEAAWLVTGGAVLIAVVVAAILLGFAYCLFKRPDALRSERYSLKKMELQLLGDSRSGLRDAVEFEGYAGQPRLGANSEGGSR
jgi:hypothetical protein